jgi:uncharacterized membrane protein YadS
MAMTALGMETRFSQIREASPRALATGAILYAWLFAAGWQLPMACSTCSAERFERRTLKR